MQRPHKREISTALYYERNHGYEEPIAAIAWEDEDWYVCPAPTAPPLALVRLQDRVGRPIDVAIADLDAHGYLSARTIVKAKGLMEAARIAIDAALRREGAD